MKKRFFIDTMRKKTIIRNIKKFNKKNAVSV